MQFQSTLPRRERPGCRIFLKSYLDISIHAPTKGATNDYSKSSYSNSISIHALTKGATASWQFHLLRKIISIHAPTKGATAASTSDIYHEIISIHAPTKGATIPRFCRKVNSLFQSTLPRRERHRLRRMPLVMYNFNPRSHEGSDENVGYLDFEAKDISIHAPTKGATSPWIKHTDVPDISIHAPTKGATRFFYPAPEAGVISIHAPTKGATVRDRFDVQPVDISIHAPTKGATRCWL